MPTITGQRLSQLSTLAIGSTDTNFYVESAAGNSYIMPEINLYNTLYNLQLSGNFCPKNEDWRFVHKTGNEGITGNKVFANDISAATVTTTYLYGDFLQGNSAPNSYINLNTDEIIAEDEVTSIHWNNRILSGNWIAQQLKSPQLITSGLAPATYNTVGISGQIVISGAYLYVATGNSLWGRVLLQPW